MRIIQNKLLPVRGFYLLNLLGFVFVRSDRPMPDMDDLRHEAIHTKQQYEVVGLGTLLGLVASTYYASWWYVLCAVALPFVLYIIGYISAGVRARRDFCRHGAPEGAGTGWAKVRRVVGYVLDAAYYKNWFEREAYEHQYDVNYLVTASVLSWVKYI